MTTWRERMVPTLGRLRPRMTPVATAGAAAIAVAVFFVAVITGRNEPSSMVGIGFGIAAAMTLGLVMSYSARRSRPAMRSLGPARVYYSLHVWGGLLFCVLFLLHTDFRLPRAAFIVVLWGLSLWVVASGALGWFFQWLVPKVVSQTSSFEVNLQRVPDLVTQLRTQAEAVAAKAEPRVATYYAQQIAPDMAGPRMAVSLSTSAVRRAGHATGAVGVLRRTLPEEGIAALESLCELHATKHEIDRQFTLQRILRGWLFVHVTVAIALLGLVALHVFLILYF